MAEIKSKMQSLGVEKCTGCEKGFKRGDTMTAVEYDNGDPAGWFCDECLAVWKRTGVCPEPRGAE